MRPFASRSCSIILLQNGYHTTVRVKTMMIKLALVDYNDELAPVYYNDELALVCSEDYTITYTSGPNPILKFCGQFSHNHATIRVGIC